ncbi:MAG: hypothetical protein ACO29Q_08055 [Crocinitomicaceae bacterium]
MLTRYHRSIALFLSVLIGLQSISCTWEPYMEYDMLFDRDMVFHHAKKNTTYNAWYYNTELYKSDNLRYENADSWVAFLENAYQRKDIMEFIYRGETSFGSRDKELINLRKNRIKALKTPSKENQFVDCIVFALKVEKMLENYLPDPWEDEPIKINIADFSPLINQANAQILSNQDPFIKERYAFQLMKLYRYSKQYSAFTANFKKHFEGKQSMIGFWAMEHYAGVLKETKKIAEANYYFAKVYVNCPAKRSSAYLSMSLSSPSDFARTISLCATEEEKMALYYIHAMQTKTLAQADLTEITQKLGNHEYARVVMSHEINKLEKILFNRAKSEEDFEYQGDRMKALHLLKAQVPAYLTELIQLNQGMLDKDDSDAFWHLSLSYLYYLNHQHDECSQMLRSIQEKTPEIQKQHDIIFIINYIDAHPTLTEEDEQIIGEKLYAVNENNPNYPFLAGETWPMGNYTNESFLIEEYNSTNEFIFRKIAERYGTSNAFITTIFSGDFFTNDLCVKSATAIDVEKDYSKFQVTVADIDRILADLKRTPQTKLALFAASYYFQTPDNSYSENRKLPTLPFRLCEQKLLELKATILLRNPAKIDEVLQIYAALPPEMIQENVVYGSPFDYTSKTPNFALHDENQGRMSKMTRMQFAQNVKRLATQPLTAENAFQLGVAYYNASYYGLQWGLLAYYRPYSSPDGNVDMRVAESYLNTALSLGGLSRDRQAQTYFMLARCEQNRYTLSNGEFSDYSFIEDFYAMKRSGNMRNFQTLVANYAGTAGYQDIIRSCKYLAYYLN